MALVQDDNEKKSGATEQINSFFQKNRKFIFFGFLAVIVILAGFIIGISVKGKMTEKALSKVDDFSRRYSELNGFAGGNNTAESVLKQADIAMLVVEINEFAKKSFGFSAARAYGLSGDILSNQYNWESAETAYLNAAKAAGKSYFTPVCFFNAAVAAEEQGNIESAVAHYGKSLDFGNSFPAAARAQFSIGRLEEARNNKASALEAYGAVMAKWPGEQLWANLAQNRIILLSD